MEARAEHGDVPGVRPRAILSRGAEMGAPQFLLVFRIKREIDLVFGFGRSGFRAPSEDTREAFASTARLAADKSPTLFRRPLTEVTEPVSRIARKPQHPKWRDTNAIEARVGRHSIDHGEHSHPLALRDQLLGHLKRDFTAKTITAEMIWPFRLKCAKLADVVRRHVFDGGEFIQAIHAA